MSDLAYIDRTIEVKVAGQDATGLGVNFVTADAIGNMFVRDYADGPVTPGTAAAVSTLIGAQYNSTLPTLTTAQQSAIQLDSFGRIINGSVIQSVNGSITTGGGSVVSSGGGTVFIQVTGTWTGSLSVVGTIGAAGYGLFVSETHSATPEPYVYGAITANGLYKVLNPSAYGTISLTGPTSTGTAVITISCGAAANIVEVVQFDQANLLGTSFQGGTWTTGRTWTLASGSDSVSVVQTTSPWVTKDQANGPVAPGTAASFSELMGGVFNTVLPTLTNTQQSAIQLDSSGRLIIRPLTSADVVSAVQSGTWNIGTVTSITNPVAVTQSGTWTVQQGTPPWTVQGDSASGASKAGNPVQIGGVFNTTQPTVTTGQTVEAQSTARGALIVSTGVDNFNINNISGTVSLPTGAATSANQATEITSLQLIDNPVGSVAAGTAGTNSFLTGGVFNTALPTLTTGQQVATQLDSSGRVIVAPLTSTSTVTGNQGTPNTVANAWPVKVTDGTDTGLVTTNGDQKVSDGLRNGGVYGALNIPTANTAVEAKVGVSRLANRKFLQIVIQNTNIWYGLDSSVTTSNGTPTTNNQVLQFSIDPDSTFQIWLVGNANNKNVQIIECP